VKKFLSPTDLKVFDTLPTDAINTNIADTFVPLAKNGSNSTQKSLAALRERTFAGWPSGNAPLDTRRVFTVEQEGIRLSAWDLTSQHDVRLRLYLMEPASGGRPEKVDLTILNQADWTGWLHSVSPAFGPQLSEELSTTNSTGEDRRGLERFKSRMAKDSVALAFFAPRGIGLDAWTADEKALTKIRRRFMLLGQTLEGMRVWDIRRAVQAVHYVREDDRAKVELTASGDMAVNALYAALFEPNVKRLSLSQLPTSHANGPDYLGVLQIWDISQALEAETARAEVQLR
jgi:hypothetical protein